MSTASTVAPKVKAVIGRLVIDTTGCLLWPGANSNGYGRVCIDYRYYAVHRVVYEALVGPIPEGLDLDHLCRVPACSNPLHLEPVTHAENIRRGNSRWDGRTTCSRGHELTPENTRIRSDGGRRCITCRREQTRRGRRLVDCPICEGSGEVSEILGQDRVTGLIHDRTWPCTACAQRGQVRALDVASPLWCSFCGLSGRCDRCAA